jgi:hypothetical protein
MQELLYVPFTQSNPNAADGLPLSNYQTYTKAAKASKVIVDNDGNIKKGATYWSQVSFDGFALPAQGQFKPYCKKWVSWGCDNTKQHPKGKHYAEHEQKTCKVAHCPKCFESWISRQANRSAKRFSKYTENKQFHFRHIVLSPPPERAAAMSYDDLKKELGYVLKIANIKTAAVVFHPFRFEDREKIQPKVSPHFHLIVYGKITNTTEFYNKARWTIVNKGDLRTNVDIFNCVRYMLSHAGVRKRTHVIRYLGEISYRKLKVEKEPKIHFCPYCELPLTVFFIKNSPKSVKPPIDHVGLWEKSNFTPYYPNDNSHDEPGVPFYELKKKPESESDYKEYLHYSFEEILAVNTALPKILERKNGVNQFKKTTGFDSMKITSFT